MAHVRSSFGFGPSPVVKAMAPSEGYLGSTLDLRAGLDVRLVSSSLVPHETWAELRRLRESWQAPPRRPAAAA